MKANYHTHTFRCHHASGTERAYVEAAIRAGFKTLGFSDHSPYPFDHGYVSGIRMDLSELEGYCRVLEGLQREYASDIEILIGLEAEYFPRHFDALCDFLKDYPIRYLLLAQHFTDNEYDGIYAGAPTRDESVLRAYCEQAAEGIKSGRFLYLAHPDLIPYTGPGAVYDRWLRWLIRQAKEAQMPLEINLLGISGRRHYPNPRFWKLAEEEQAEAILGCDAHSAAHLLDVETIWKGEELAFTRHLNLLEELPVKKHFQDS